MSKQVAILGANGFVGFRAFQNWHRSGPFTPRAVVRRPGSLAQIARFEADWRLADAADRPALATAFEGCCAVVHCVVGDAKTIEATTLPVLEACADAGVKRLVFLSSASVHGQNPTSGTTEATPLDNQQAMWYNNAKVDAEHALTEAAKDSPVELVILRPGIVWGARSFWVSQLVDELGHGKAAWLRRGEGICNSIHVDNLVHAIERAIMAEQAAGEVFLLNDPQTVRWRDLYLPIVEALGETESAIAEGRPTEPTPPGLRDKVLGLKSTAPAQAVLKVIPAKAKETVKGGLRALTAPPKANPFALQPADTAPPRLSAEMSALYACQYRFPYDKATELLGYAPPISLEAGLRDTLGWMRMIGILPSEPKK